MPGCFPKLQQHLHSHQVIVPSPLHPHQHILLSVFLIRAILAGMTWYLFVFWCTFPILYSWIILLILFLYLLTILVCPPWRNVHLDPLPIFLTKLSFYYWGHAERQVQCLDREDSLEEGMATHSRILAWRIPWTEEPGELDFMGFLRVGHNWSDLACTHASCILDMNPWICNLPAFSLFNFI